MEASGLLGAELNADGSVRLESGDLVAVAATAVPAPLSEFVVVSIPDNVGGVEPATVAALLDSISTDPASASSALVSIDGTFRMGALSGRHHKDGVEHIGAGARKAALERKRAEAAANLEAAHRNAEKTRASVQQHRRRIDGVVELRLAIPGPAAVSDALAMLNGATEHLEERRLRLSELVEAEREAEGSHTAAVTESRRLAVNLRLPADRAGLESFLRLVEEATALSARAEALLDALARSHHRWVAAAREWMVATDDQRAAAGALVDRRAAHEQAEARLATLEDSVGLDYADVLASLEVCRSDLSVIRTRLPEARAGHDQALERRSRHEAETEAALMELTRLEGVCASELEMLRHTMAVPGLVKSTFGRDAEFPVVAASSEGLGELASAIADRVSPPEEAVTAESVRQSLRRRRDSLGAGWDAQDRQPDPGLPLSIEINGPLGRMTLSDAMVEVSQHRDRQASLLSAKQDQALRNLLQGLIAREVSDKLASAAELVRLMNRRLETVSTSHGIGARLRWRRRDNLDPSLGSMIDLLSKPPDLRTSEEDDALTAALSNRISDARMVDPEQGYRDLVRDVLDYRRWHEMGVYVVRGSQPEQRLSRRTPLSEGEKKIVSYLPLFAAVAASSDALAAAEPSCPRFVLLDDAFAKVSEDNHARLFGLLVEMDLDFIATSERLWGTHSTVPELAITEVVRDAGLGVIVLEHATWNGRTLEEAG